MAKKKNETADIRAAILDRPNKDQRGAYWISSGSDLMDLVVGGGRGMGYETGMSVLFEANSQGGKSFMAHEVIASAFYKYKEKAAWQYQDCESGCTFDSKKLWGIEIMPPAVEDRVRPETIEDCFSQTMLMARKQNDGPTIIVTDSLDGLLSEKGNDRAEERIALAEKGKDFEEKTMGMEKALFMSRTFWPKINSEIEKRNCLYIAVGQYRETAGQYGPVKKISNGQGSLYYPHARVKFTKKQDIGPEARPIGAVVEVSTIKMKGPWPSRSCLISFYFSRGIDNVGTNVDYLFGFRTAEGKLSVLAERGACWNEGMDKMDRETMIRYIEDNNLEGELTQRVIDKWNDEEKAALKPLEGRKSRYGS